MAEKRTTGRKIKVGLNLKDGEVEDINKSDELHLAGNEEETKGTITEEEEEKKEETPTTRPQFPKPISRESVQSYSRWLHRITPSNRYFRVKIPYKTIFISFIFLIVGCIMLYFGFNEMLENGNSTECWEKIILGLILWIPGSFHSFIAI